MEKKEDPGHGGEKENCKGGGARNKSVKHVMTATISGKRKQQLTDPPPATEKYQFEIDVSQMLEGWKDKNLLNDSKVTVTVDAETVRQKYPHYQHLMSKYLVKSDQGQIDQQKAQDLQSTRSKKYAVVISGLEEAWSNLQLKELALENARIRNERKKLSKQAVREATKGTDDVAYVEFGVDKYEVTLESLKHLRKGQQLNDIIMNYGMALVAKELKLNPSMMSLMTTYAFQRIFAENLLPSDVRVLYRSLTKNKKDKNLLENRFIVFPVGRDGHWFLIVICNPFPKQELVESKDEIIAKINTEGIDTDKKKERTKNELYLQWIKDSKGRPTIYIMDSLLDKAAAYLGANYATFHQKGFEVVSGAILSLHNEFWKRTNRPHFIVKDNMKHVSFGDKPVFLKMPQQPNGTDCGVFVMEFVKQFFEALKHLEYEHDGIEKKIDFRANNADVVAAACERRGSLQERILEDCAKQYPQHLKAVKKQF